MPKSAGVERSKTSYIPVINHIGHFDTPKSAGVERSKTSYIPRVTNTRDFDAEKFISPVSAGVTRSNTQIIPARPSPHATIGGQFRSLSIRKPGTSTHVPSQGAHFKSNKKLNINVTFRWDTTSK